MSDKKLPAYITLAPFVLVATVGLIGYLLGSSFTAENIPNIPKDPSAGLEDVIEDLKKKVLKELDLDKLFEEKKKKKRELRRKLAKTKANIERKRKSKAKKKSEPLLDKPITLIDFSSGDPGNVKMRTRNSAGISSSVTIDKFFDDSGGQAALFSVQGMRGKSGSHYASAMFQLEKPVTVGSGHALVLDIETRGIKALAIGLLDKKGSRWNRWDRQYVKFSKDGQVTRGKITSFFYDHTQWLYDNNSRKYTKVDKGTAPIRVTQINIYIRSKHLASGRTGGDIWIKSVEIR